MDVYISFGGVCFMIIAFCGWTYAVYFFTRMTYDDEYRKEKMKQDRADYGWAEEMADLTIAFICGTSPYNSV